MHQYNVCIITKDKNSTNYTRCYERCKEFGYKEIQYIQDNAEERVGSITADNHIPPFRQSKDKTDSTFVRYYSHHKEWKATSEQNKPYLIIEDDAYQIVPIPYNILHFLDDVINFSDGENDFENILEELKPNKKHGENFNDFLENSLKNQSAYLISPNGANKLLDFTTRQGWLPVNIHISSLILNLKYYRRKFFI